MLDTASSPTITVSEMAAALNTTEAAIRGQIARKRLKVRKLLRGEYSRADFEAATLQAQRETGSEPTEIARALKAVLVELLAENRVSIQVSISVEPKAQGLRSFQRLVR